MNKDLKERLDKVKVKFHNLFRMTAKYASQQTDKGLITYDGDLILGKEVFLTANDNDPVPAPDGTYTITSGEREGESFTTENGIVATISEESPTQTGSEEVPAVESETHEELKQEVSALEDAFERLLDVVEEVGDRLEPLDEKIESLPVNYVSTEKYNALLSRVEALENTPATTTLKKTKMSSQAPTSFHNGEDLCPAEFANSEMFKFLQNRK